MSEKTNTFFIIHNYNTIPEDIIKYCNDYIIYDCSDNKEVVREIKEKSLNVRFNKNTGHNISSYFTFFAENYNNLPDMMCLLKGNIFSRHCSEEFFERVYNNKYFTYLYEDKNVYLKKNINFLAMENMYCEVNDSSYVSSVNHPHEYFDNLNRLLKFIYKNPVLPEYCLFAPGACYIVSKEQVLLHSKEFYVNLNKIMTYGMNPSFPSEAHQIERLLPVIFTCNYEENEWMNDVEMFDEKLVDEAFITKENDRHREETKKIIYKIKRKLRLV